MVKKPEYLKPVTDRQVVKNLQNAFSDTSKRDRALEEYRKNRERMRSAQQEGTMLKRISIINNEADSLFFGNSREIFEVPREKWQDAFVTFLEKCGFDYDGYSASSSLNEYVRSESYPLYRFDEVEINAEEIRKNGLQAGDEYEYNGERYLITGGSEDSLDELFEDLDDPKMDERGNAAETVFRVMKTEKTEEDIWFENEVFLVRPYFWGNSEEVSKAPNFVYKPDNFAMKWYKHPLRGAYCNKNIDYKYFINMLKKCSSSLQKG